MANNTKSKATEVVEEKKTKTFEPDDNIKCVSVTAGELLMVGKKTGILYKWADYGDTAYVEYQDLKAEAYSSRSPYIYSPLFMIEDEDVLKSREFAKVAETYKNAVTVDEMEDFFKLSLQQFKSTLKKLPNGIKDAVKAIAVDKINDGSLDSIQKIKAIDEVLGTELYNLLVS